MTAAKKRPPGYSLVKLTNVKQQITKWNVWRHFVITYLLYILLEFLHLVSQVSCVLLLIGFFRFTLRFRLGFLCRRSGLTSGDKPDRIYPSCFEEDQPQNIQILPLSPLKINYTYSSAFLLSASSFASSSAFSAASWLRSSAIYNVRK